MRKIRVLLVDDHAVLRAGLRLLVDSQPDMVVVGEAGDGQEGIWLAGELKPDVVLMDIAMPGMDGIEAMRLLAEKAPESRVLFLSMYQEEEYLRRVLAAGAAGYILKRAAGPELLIAIRAVDRGDVYLDPALTRMLVEDYLDRGLAQPPQEEPPAVSLTPRELEVLRLVAQGHTNREIAEILVVSVKTVETHKANIMKKLGLHSRAELVRYALRRGLLGGS